MSYADEYLSYLRNMCLYHRIARITRILALFFNFILHFILINGHYESAMITMEKVQF